MGPSKRLVAAIFIFGIIGGVGYSFSGNTQLFQGDFLSNTLSNVGTSTQEMNSTDAVNSSQTINTLNATNDVLLFADNTDESNVCIHLNAEYTGEPFSPFTFDNNHDAIIDILNVITTSYNFSGSTGSLSETAISILSDQMSSLQEVGEHITLAYLESTDFPIAHEEISRILTIVEDECGLNSHVNEITYEPPTLDDPNITSPTSEELNVSVNPIITWEPIEGAINYNLSINSIENGIGMPCEEKDFCETGITATSLQVPEDQTLEESTEYRLTLSAFNAEGESSGNALLFSTEFNGPTLCSYLSGPYTADFYPSLVFSDNHDSIAKVLNDITVIYNQSGITGHLGTRAIGILNSQMNSIEEFGSYLEVENLLTADFPVVHEEISRVLSIIESECSLSPSTVTALDIVQTTENVLDVNFRAFSDEEHLGDPLVVKNTCATLPTVLDVTEAIPQHTHCKNIEIDVTTVNFDTSLTYVYISYPGDDGESRLASYYNLGTANSGHIERITWDGTTCGTYELVAPGIFNKVSNLECPTDKTYTINVITRNEQTGIEATDTKEFHLRNN